LHMCHIKPKKHIENRQQGVCLLGWINVTWCKTNRYSTIRLAHLSY